MTVTCIVCKKQPTPGNNFRSFHKFPDDDKEKHKWLQAIGITSITKHSRICSDHFYANSFHDTDGYTTKRRLLPNAIPYITTNTVLSNIINKTLMPREQTEPEILRDLKCLDIDNKYTKCNNELSGNQSFFNETRTLLKETEVQSSVTHDHSYDELINTYAIDISPNHFAGQDYNSSNISLTSDNCESSKRKLSDIDVEDFNPKKKIRFMDGCKATCISREDFISDEAWKRFLKYHIYRLRQVEASRKSSLRKMKKIMNFKELIKTLRDENDVAAANYLKVN